MGKDILINQDRLQYLHSQLDRVRATSDSARSVWSRQWFANLEQRLLKEIQFVQVMSETTR